MIDATIAPIVRTRVLLLAVLPVLLACEDPETSDAGADQPDAALLDAGAPDAAKGDDARPGDALAADAEQDAGVPADAASPDALTADATPFPVKVAYSANAEDLLLRELYLTDTSTSRAKVNPPLAGGPAGGSKEPETAGLQELAWIWDGQQLLYSAQQDTYDLVELYAAEAAGRRPGPSRKLSLPASSSGAGIDLRSPVSARVAFRQHDGTSTNLYVVSATAAPPLPRRISQGLALSAEWSPTADAIAFQDIIVSADDRDLWFAQVYPGAPAPVRVNPGAGIGFGGALAWAPDGSSFVYAADESALRLFELFWVRVNNGLLDPPLRLHPAFPASADIAIGLARGAGFSPDGTRVAYVADARTDQRNELFIVDVSGPVISAPLVVSATAAAGNGVQRFTWTGDGRRLLYVSDPTSPGVYELFLADPTGATRPIRLSPPISGGWVAEERLVNGDRAVVFEVLDGGRMGLYAVDLSGAVPSAPIEVSHMLAMDDGINRWDVSADGLRAVYRTTEAAGGGSAYALDLSTFPPGAPQLLIHGPVEPTWCWTPAGHGLALAADLDTAGTGELYFLADPARPGAVKISGPMTPGGRVFDCAFPPR